MNYFATLLGRGQGGCRRTGLMRWLFDAEKLLREQLRVLKEAANRAEPFALSAIIFLENALLYSDGQLKIQLPDFLQDTARNPVFQILPVTAEIGPKWGPCAIHSTGQLLPRPAFHRLSLVASDQRIIDSSFVIPVL